MYQSFDKITQLFAVLNYKLFALLHSLKINVIYFKIIQIKICLVNKKHLSLCIEINQ